MCYVIRGSLQSMRPMLVVRSHKAREARISSTVQRRAVAGPDEAQLGAIAMAVSTGRILAPPAHRRIGQARVAESLNE